MAKFVVFTTFTSQELRTQHRAEHRVYLHKLVDQGSLLFAGPFEDDESGGGAEKATPDQFKMQGAQPQQGLA